MHVTTTAWLITVAVLCGVLLFDVLVVGRRPHEPSHKEAGTAVTIYITLAVIFGIVLGMVTEWRFSEEFFLGWVTEYSLSVDNLFIFLVIMSRFAVPRKFQQTALLVGIILALVFRGIFIALGATAIKHLSWIFYLFGAFLIYTAIALVKNGLDDDEYKENRLIRFAKNRLPATDQWNGVRLTVVENGKRLITPMFLVIVALGTTDLMFALDSIPAIYGLTNEPYIVFSANVFALMGLRQLYFLLGGMLSRLVYLSLGLSVILAFIGVKLILEALGSNELSFINGGLPLHVPHITPRMSMIVIASVLIITLVASLLKSRGKPTAGSSADSADSTRGTDELSVDQADKGGAEPAEGVPVDRTAIDRDPDRTSR